jgi:hypothetical protein
MIDLKPYQGPYGLIECNKTDIDGENAILYSNYYLAAVEDLEYHSLIEEIIATKLHVGPGLYHSRINDKGQMSHDNLTAIMFMLDDNRRLAVLKEVIRQKGRYDDQFPQDPSWSRILHPRDMIYYGILGGSYIAWLFFPVFAIMMLLSCFETKEKDGSYSTTSKRLFWLRCKTLPENRLFSLLFRLGTFIISKNDLNTWNKIFLYFFKQDENHPCVLATKDV